MKKIVYLMQIGVFALLFSTAAFADDWGHGWGHHHGHHGWGHHHGHHGWRQPVINNYYPQPQYYAPPPQYYGGYNDNRSHQGLAGGVLGTVFGYELGNGHPLAAGVGAAAGSFLGNGMGWRY